MSDEFEVIDIIGRGSFGQITKVRRLSDGLVMARKEISYKTMNPKEKSQLISEFRILKNLQHPNIVRYYHHEHIPETHMVYLYMEYCGGGDLGSLILQCSESGELVPEHIIWGIFTQLILALYRCHYNNDPPVVGNLFCFHDDPLPPSNPSTVILHRDIKPDNIFLDKDNSVKVGDFGLAKMLDQEHFFANTYVGTPYYMSPDVLLDQPYTPQSDIWSLGCVIYELCKLNPPFQAKTHMQLTQKIKEGIFPPIPDVYSSTLSRTIAACLNLNPANRPTTATLLRLDIIKLCRKERNVLETHMSLLALEEKLKERERALVTRENAITSDLEAYKLALETDIFKRLENDLHQTIEMEVERRVGDRLKRNNSQTSITSSSSTTSSSASSTATLSNASNNVRAMTGISNKLSGLSPTENFATGVNGSPAGLVNPSTNSNSSTSIPSTTVLSTSSRQLKGPRSINDSIISPLKDMRRDYKYNPTTDTSSFMVDKNNSNTNINRNNSSAGYNVNLDRIRSQHNRSPTPKTYSSYNHGFSDDDSSSNGSSSSSNNNNNIINKHIISSTSSLMSSPPSPIITSSLSTSPPYYSSNRHRTPQSTHGVGGENDVKGHQSISPIYDNFQTPQKYRDYRRKVSSSSISSGNNNNNNNSNSNVNVVSPVRANLMTSVFDTPTKAPTTIRENAFIDLESNEKIWDNNNVYDEDMPSPFLKKWEMRSNDVWK